MTECVHHAVRPEELAEELVLEAVAQDGDAARAEVGEEGEPFRLAGRERRELGAVRCLVGLVRLVAGDHAAELGEGGREHAGKARVVVVVGVGDRKLAVAVLPGERGEGSSLVGVGGRDPEHEVVVVEVRDRGRGRGVGKHHHAGRDGDGLGHAVGGARAVGADDRHCLLDVDELRAHVDRGLRVALRIALHEPVGVSAEQATLLIHVARGEIAGIDDGDHQLRDGTGNARRGTHIDFARGGDGAVHGERDRGSG